MQLARCGLGPAIAALAALLAVSGCSGTGSGLGEKFTAAASMINPVRAFGYHGGARERECLARAIFFESNRSSRDGMIAVGSVVMNRKDSGKWGDTVCEVVGAKKQFAPGVLTRPMNSKAVPDVMAAADAVLKGERHPKVGKDVMFFHTAGLKFPYKNMRYTTVAGGNAFYYKRSRKGDRLPARQSWETETAVAQAAPRRKERSGWFARRKSERGRLGEEDAVPIRIALAGETPIPVSRHRLEPAEPVSEDGWGQEAPDPSLPKKASRKAAAAAEVAVAVEPGSATPSAERFGGGPDAARFGDPDGAGFAYVDAAGVLGQLVIEGD